MFTTLQQLVYELLKGEKLWLHQLIYPLFKATVLLLTAELFTVE